MKTFTPYRIHIEWEISNFKRKRLIIRKDIVFKGIAFKSLKTLTQNI